MIKLLLLFIGFKFFFDSLVIFNFDEGEKIKFYNRQFKIPFSSPNNFLPVPKNHGCPL